MTEPRTSPVNDGDLFTERVRRYAKEHPLHPVQVLEAGCGWGRGLDLGGLDHRLTGVDLDTPALRARTKARTDLHGWHLGDLRTVPMPPRAYDIVYGDYLIERIPQAELVLDRFVAALKPGGLLLLRLRDRGSAFGFLDRVLPSWSHGGSHAGAHAGPAAGDAGGGSGSPPPTTVYDRVASRQGMQWYCVMRGLVVAEEYASRERLDAMRAGIGLAGGLCRVVSAFSRGRLAAAHSEVTFVIRKPENRFARLL
ncbi:class I SAM-dependent methyltransferase [Actinomadura parmotrematis]|uniref:Class I SAM-dependent methyltransferase n=1 Tax=Actinomadura parmotrematis TaxID=2864039 RepID=A0ABS7FMJ5_9ACTN|nr:class I SAM-dependent methyltransferase [Actinomadura parmotrematis]MBW8481603.1 class I SAM-dependent methyltransferase [Actinomadura parmotrematis]